MNKSQEFNFEFKYSNGNKKDIIARNETIARAISRVKHEEKSIISITKYKLI